LSPLDREWSTVDPTLTRVMDRRGIILAIVVVLIVVAMVAVRSSRRKAGEGFLAAMVYNPCFIDPLGTSRYTCKGYTSGVPPSIETEQEGGWLCPGAIGVPP
jgi:hypothetical protein